MRYILWGDGEVPEHVELELARIIAPRAGRE